MAYPFSSAIGYFVIGFSPIGGYNVAPVTLLKTIPSYLYVQYRDDDSLQAFVASYNVMTQQYVDWFNEVNLPVWTGLDGLLLDWVAEGLYGIARPLLPAGAFIDVGPLNTFTPNELDLNGIEIVAPAFYATSDDVFKRILTWRLYKGDGKQFTIPWLKRRVARFLYGDDGEPYDVHETWNISVVVLPDEQVVIRVIDAEYTNLAGAILDDFALNEVALNQASATVTPLPVPAAAQFLPAVFQSGVLDLPLGYTYTVQV